MEKTEIEVDEDAKAVLVCIELEAGQLDGVVATVGLTTYPDTAEESGMTDTNSYIHPYYPHNVSETSNFVPHSVQMTMSH